MSPETLVLLYAAGVLAGIVSVLVSLASIVSYPALLAVGLPPVAANVTNTVALVLTGVGASLGSRRELAGLQPVVMRLAVAAAAGGLTGALLLLVLPDRVFELVAPVLIAGASLLLLAQPRLRERPLLRPRGLRPGPRRGVHGDVRLPGLLRGCGRHPLDRGAVHDHRPPVPRRERRQEHPRRVLQRGRRGRVHPAGTGPVGLRGPACAGDVHGRAGGTVDRTPGAGAGAAARGGRVRAHGGGGPRLGNVRTRAVRRGDRAASPSGGSIIGAQVGVRPSPAGP